MSDVTDRVLVPDVPPPPPGWRRVGPPLFPRTTPRPLFGLGLAIAALALYSIGQLVPLLVLNVSGSERTLENAFALIAALGQAVGIGLVLGLLRVRRVPLRAIVGSTRPMRRLVLLGLGVGLASVVANALLGAFVVLITGTQDAPEQALFGDALAGGSRMLLAVVAAGILAPLIEEVLFRGLLYRALRRRQSVALAAVLSSLAFAVIHAEIVVSQPLALINLTLLAVLWAVLYERTGSLIVPIVAHSVFNLMSIGQVLLLSRFGLLGVQSLVPDRLGVLL
jgi:membrane protease YdiL (CAAX protease family)